MPDTYCRLQSSTNIATMGALPIALGCAIYGFAIGNSSLGIKALVIMFFLIITNPVASHAMTESYMKQRPDYLRRISVITMGGMKRMNSFTILNTIIILGMIIAAASLLFIEDLLPSIIAMSIMGSFLALEFLLLKAPDVALAEAAVGAILTPIIFIVTLKKVKDKKDDKEEEK